MAQIQMKASSERPDPRQRAKELRKLVTKLRWMGSDDLAERVKIELIRTAPPGFVFVVPGDTD